MNLSKRTKYLLYGSVLVVVSLGTIASVPGISTVNSTITIPSPYKSAYPAFRPLVSSDTTVPRNVLKALYVPANAKIKADINYDGGSGTFDRAIVLSTTYSQRQINSFFIASLKHFGWNIIQDSSRGNGVQIFASIAGSDGHYWEVGIKTPFQISSISGRVTVFRSENTTSANDVQLRILQMSFE